MPAAQLIPAALQSLLQRWLAAEHAGKGEHRGTSKAATKVDGMNNAVTAKCNSTFAVHLLGITRNLLKRRHSEADSPRFS